MHTLCAWVAPTGGVVPDSGLASAPDVRVSILSHPCTPTLQGSPTKLPRRATTAACGCLGAREESQVGEWGCQGGNCTTKTYAAGVSTDER